MIWTIAIAIVLYIAYRFFSDVNKDNNDLQGTTVDGKFQVLANLLNEAAFNGQARIIPLDKRSFNLYQDGKNQLINFLYGTGHLTITWKYKYFQKEVVHKKVFHDVRNLSIFDQQKMAENIANEMAVVIQKHQNNVLG